MGEDALLMFGGKIEMNFEGIDSFVPATHIAYSAIEVNRPLQPYAHYRRAIDGQYVGCWDTVFCDIP